MECPSGLPNIDGKDISMKDVIRELKEVSNKWFQLGVYLNIPESELRKIGLDCHRDVNMCMIELIMTWKQRFIPTWKDIIDALAEIGMHTLAVKLARKYSETLLLYRLG